MVEVISEKKKRMSESIGKEQRISRSVSNEIVEEALVRSSRKEERVTVFLKSTF